MHPLLPWDLHSKQGLLFNGTVIKCAVSKRFPCYSPIRLKPPSPLHPPFPHSTAFLDASKSPAAEQRPKCSWENRNGQLVTHFVFPHQTPAAGCRGQRGSRGSSQLAVVAEDFQNKTRSSCSNVCVACFVKSRFGSLKKNQSYTNTTAHNHLKLITPFQLLVARLGSLPLQASQSV